MEVDCKKHFSDEELTKYSTSGSTEYRDGHFWHRDNGPAIEFLDGQQEWYWHDVRHRIDGPAKILPDGSKEYWLLDTKYSEAEWSRKKDSILREISKYDFFLPKEKIFRRIIPGSSSIEYRDLNFSLHRDKEPAYQGSYVCIWYQKGLRHRKDGPAQVDLGWHEIAWFYEGKRYELDGWLKNLPESFVLPSTLNIKMSNHSVTIHIKDNKYHNAEGPAIEWSDGHKEYWIDGKKIDYSEFEKYKKEKETLSDISNLLKQMREIAFTGKNLGSVEKKEVEVGIKNEDYPLNEKIIQLENEIAVLKKDSQIKEFEQKLEKLGKALDESRDEVKKLTESLTPANLLTALADEVAKEGEEYWDDRLPPGEDVLSMAETLEIVLNEEFDACSSITEARICKIGEQIQIVFVDDCQNDLPEGASTFSIVQLPPHPRLASQDVQVAYLSSKDADRELSQPFNTSRYGLVTRDQFFNGGAPYLYRDKNNIISYFEDLSFKKLHNANGYAYIENNIGLWAEHGKWLTFSQWQEKYSEKQGRQTNQQFRNALLQILEDIFNIRKMNKVSYLVEDKKHLAKFMGSVSTEMYQKFQEECNIGSAPFCAVKDVAGALAVLPMSVVPQVHHFNFYGETIDPNTPVLHLTPENYRAEILKLFPLTHEELAQKANDIFHQKLFDKVVSSDLSDNILFTPIQKNQDKYEICCKPSVFNKVKKIIEESLTSEEQELFIVTKEKVSSQLPSRIGIQQAKQLLAKKLGSQGKVTTQLLSYLAGTALKERYPEVAKELRVSSAAELGGQVFDELMTQVKQELAETLPKSILEEPVEAVVPERVVLLNELASNPNYS